MLTTDGAIAPTKTQQSTQPIATNLAGVLIYLAHLLAADPAQQQLAHIAALATTDEAIADIYQGLITTIQRSEEWAISLSERRKHDS